MTAPEEVERLARVMFENDRRMVPTKMTWGSIGVRRRAPYLRDATAILASGYSRTAETLERAAVIADAAADELEQYQDGHYVESGDPTTLAAIGQARDIATAIRAAKET